MQKKTGNINYSNNFFSQKDKKNEKRNHKAREDTAGTRLMLMLYKELLPTYKMANKRIFLMGKSHKQIFNFKKPIKMAHKHVKNS